MMDTVKKRHKYFHWTEEAENIFNLLKRKITEQPILVLSDFQKTFQVKCDASGFAIGVVLSQEDRPIAYFSEKLNEEKVKYSTYDKEFYAIIHPFNKWSAYWIKELARRPGESNTLNIWSSGKAIQLKMPDGRVKQRSRGMDTLYTSSWTGAHEKFQAREYDAGASQASQLIRGSNFAQKFKVLGITSNRTRA
jgi:hypothetical protein